MTKRSTPDPSPQCLSRYWSATRRLTIQLLAVWLVVTIPIIFFARELSSITLFGWPLSFYFAAQGATLIYVVIVWFYAWRMKGLDKAFKDEVGLGKVNDESLTSTNAKVDANNF